MSLIESILYGLVSGLTEFLPVSSRAHQTIMRLLFGADTRVPLQELLVHMGVLFAIVVSCRDVLVRLRREQKSGSRVQRRKLRMQDKNYYDLRLLKTASYPLILGSLLYFTTVRFESNLLLVMAFCFLNGFVLLLADHTSRGNRDSRTMSALDGIVMGIAGALSVLPGISRTGLISAYGSARGADNDNVVNWAVILGIPAMLFAMLFDVVCVFSIGFGIRSVSMFGLSLLSGVAAFGGGYMGIALLKMALERSGYSKFAYYSIGAALFSFILFLIT